MVRMTSPREVVVAAPPDERSLGPLESFARRRPLVLVGFGVFLYGIGPLFAKASHAVGPVFVFWRLWFGVLAFGIAALVHNRMTGRLPNRRAIGWAARGGVAFGVHQLLFIIAIKATTVVDVMLVGTLSPIVVGILAVPMFGERPGARFRLWSVVAMAGAAVVAVAGSTGPNGNPVGMGIALLNVFTFSAFFVISEKGRNHIDVIPFLFGTMVMASVTVSVWALIAGEPVSSISSRDLWLAFALAFGPGFVGHFVMTWPLKWVPANVPPVMRLAVPLIAGLGAWVVLGETVGWAHFAGGFVVLAGVLGAVRSMSRETGATSAQSSPGASS